ncbi:MAG: lasso peptide biosynthesis B2 protein [Colwellia sp.]|nr:lasso peptide biosynthesis B2 protein [Colwellia sp.]
MAKIVKLFQFNFKDLLVLIEAWFVFFKWDLLISNASYKQWRDKIPDISCYHKQDNATVLKAERLKISTIISITEIAGRHHLRQMNCLRRCLTQKQMLDKRGYLCHLHIGVKIEQGKVKAHSWLTFQGDIINDSHDVTTRYSELQQSDKQALIYSLK